MARRRASGGKPLKLLAGGNPQIAKADADAQMARWVKQAAALPGWVP